VVNLKDYDRGWKRALESRFDELRNLELNWDGYGGEPLDPKVEQTCKQILSEIHLSEVSAPDLMPGSDGSVQIEWHENKCDLEIHILKSQQIFVYFNDHLKEGSDELLFDERFSTLFKYVRRLAVR